jgi:hypothetical protein
MPRYTMRLCWSGKDRPNDFEVCVGGKPAGRCYLMKTADNREVWRWTVYGISGGGMEDTLAEAKRRFKETYEAAN